MSDEPRTPDERINDLYQLVRQVAEAVTATNQSLHFLDRRLKLLEQHRVWTHGVLEGMDQRFSMVGQSIEDAEARVNERLDVLSRAIMRRPQL